MKNWSMMVGAVLGLTLVMPLGSSPADAQGRMRGGAQGRMRAGGGGMDTVPGLVQNPLSAEQRRQVGEIRANTQRETARVRADTSRSMAERQAAMDKMRAESHERVMKVLTPEQRAEFANWWANRPAAGRGRAGVSGARPGAGMGRPRAGMGNRPRAGAPNAGMRGGRMGQGPGAGMGGGMMGPMMGIPGLVENPLTQDQQDRVSAIRNQGWERMRAIRDDASLTWQQRQDRMDQIRTQQHEDVMKVLTPEQRAEFQQWWSGRPRAGRMR